MVSVGTTKDTAQGTVNVLSSALSEKQRTIVKNHSPDLVQVMKTAAQTAIKECRLQFKNRKWNCSSTNPYNVFGQILQRGE